MKVNEYLETAQNELKDEKSKAIRALIKESLKDVAAAKKTLKKFENAHNDLLETDCDDLDLEDFEY